jgi:hypothetical protein
VLFAVGGAKFDHATVTGNAVGIEADGVSLVASTATGNGNYDLSSIRRPHVRRGSVCGVSQNPPNGSWHVCTDD